MTPKDHVLIADALASAQSALLGTDTLSGIGRALCAAATARVADELACALAIDNPHFDRGKFIAACGARP